MKTIKIKKSKRTSCGSYGHYFKYSKTIGVKVSFCDDCTEDGVPPDEGYSVWGRQCSYCKEEVRDENRSLKAAFSVRKHLPVGIPRPKGLVRVLRGRRAYLGVSMQHIQGRTLSAARGALKDRLIEAQSLAEEFFDDNHGENFMVRAKDHRLFRIDFGHFQIKDALVDLVKGLGT